MDNMDNDMDNDMDHQGHNMHDGKLRKLKQEFIS